ncbi:MAG: hypothetical protein ABR518_08445 [Actinomycetota bacterium]
MAETDTDQIASRSSRCAHHPAVGRIASCDSCGLPLCLACATPVRGQTIGPECLGQTLRDSAASRAEAPPPPPPVPRTDPVVVGAFAAVVAISVLPWTRFGDSSGFLRAWTLHWSLLSVSAAVAGLVAAVATWRRPRDPRVEVGVHLGLAVIVAAGALLHHLRPPPLSAPLPTPLVAVAAAVVAGMAAIIKAVALVRLRRPRTPV